jgi:hypothetical protein
MVDPTLVTDFLFAVLGDGVAVRRQMMFPEPIGGGSHTEMCCISNDGMAVVAYVGFAQYLFAIS